MKPLRSRHPWDLVLVARIIEVSSSGVIWGERQEAVSYVPVPLQKGPMGGAPYIGPRLGGGPIFEVSVSQLDVKERPRM